MLLYGTRELLRDGVTHVTSARRASDGRLHVLALGEHAPRSATDFFVLNLCRARADALVSSAGNLRSEPTLLYTLQGPEAAALARYRSDVLHKASAPVVAILTHGGTLPLEHAAWSDGSSKLVLTTHEARPRLAAELGARAEVIALDSLDARVAAAWLRARGLPLISIESGPRTLAPLYQAPALVDELLLSLYEAPADAALGGALPDALFAGSALLAESAADEQSGRWRFQRWQRSALSR